MAQIFNELIYDERVEGGTEVFTSSDYNDLLGQADDLVFQIRALDGSGTTPTITVTHYTSNDGKDWHSQATLANATSIASTPVDAMANSVGPLAGLGRVGISLGGTSPKTHVRIWACGRVD